eukprot:scaffold154140_cov17-Tisochrysis_lutea.AAC.2
MGPGLMHAKPEGLSCAYNAQYSSSWEYAGKHTFKENHNALTLTTQFFLLLAINACDKRAGWSVGATGTAAGCTA